jgi:hypothetical protein
MYSAPVLPTNTDEREQTPDSMSVQLDQNLRAIEIIDTMPSYRHNYILSTPDQGYDVGWKEQMVPNEVIVLPYHYESPELPVTQLPYSQAIFDSTLSRKQVNDEVVYTNLRAPGINEGY